MHSISHPTRCPGTHRPRAGARSGSAADGALALATGTRLQDVPDVLILTVIKSCFLSYPTSATLDFLNSVNKQWAAFIQANTTWSRTPEQPYNVVFGVLVALEVPVNWQPVSISIKPPAKARLRVIPDRAFSGALHPAEHITKVDLSLCDVLEQIGTAAFNCAYKMKTLILNGCVALQSIGKDAFCMSPLVTLELSGCVALRQIGEGAFQASKLTTLSLSPCLALQSIGGCAFFWSDLTTLNLSPCVSLQSIGPDAFFGSRMTTLNLSPCVSLQSIGQGAFHFSILSTLNLAGCIALRHIGQGAFYFSTLRTLDLDRCVALRQIGPDAFFGSVPAVRLAAAHYAPILH